MTDIQIVQVQTPSDLNAFINLPWKLYRKHPNWVPPLKKYVRKLLDTKRHPFWQFSDQLLLLARRGSETVGRIAGIIDRNYNRYHNAGMGAWGFFECINDREVARALFSRVEDWVCGQGMTFLRGPLNPSTNYEVGLLVDGFDGLPTFMMPYNPPYYLDLVESAGFRKEKDLLSFIVDRNWEPPEWMEALGRRLREQGSVTVRSGDVKNLHAEIALMKKIYDESWAKNWGFVPMTDDEGSELAANLVRIVDPDFAVFIFFKNEPAGVGLAVPDLNPLLKRLNGKIGLIGAIKWLLYRKEVRGLRGLLFGVKEEYRQLGLPFVGLTHALQVARGSDRYDYLELGWNLEDNEAINKLEEEGGARPHKRYRVYRKSFADRW